MHYARLLRALAFLLMAQLENKLQRELADPRYVCTVRVQERAGCNTVRLVPEDAVGGAGVELQPAGSAVDRVPLGVVEDVEGPARNSSDIDSLSAKRLNTPISKLLRRGMFSELRPEFPNVSPVGNW